MESEGIRIVVINGSVRPGSYTGMATALVVDELKKQPNVSVELIDPATLHLPFPGMDPRRRYKDAQAKSGQCDRRRSGHS